MRDLNCTEFEQRLALAVESRQSPAEDLDSSSEEFWVELKARASACPHCRDLWNQFALLDRVLPVWKSQIPQVDLTDAVLLRLKQDTVSAPATPPELPAKPRQHFAVLALVASMTALGFWLMFSPPAPSPTLPGTQPVAVNTPNHVPQPSENQLPETETQDWDELAQDAGSAYWGLAHNVADSFASAKLFVPAPSSVNQSPVPSAPTASPQWVEEIGQGLKPIQQDVGKAMGFLWESLPADSPAL